MCLWDRPISKGLVRPFALPWGLLLLHLLLRLWPCFCRRRRLLYSLRVSTCSLTVLLLLLLVPVRLVFSAEKQGIWRAALLRPGLSLLLVFIRLLRLLWLLQLRKLLP